MTLNLLGVGVGMEGDQMCNFKWAPPTQDIQQQIFV